MLLAAGGDARLDELAHQVEYLAREGAELVVVNAQDESEQIVELAQSREWPCRIEVVVEAELLGSAGGLRNALPHFEPHMPIAVLNAGAPIDVPLHRIVDEHIQSGLAATICAGWLRDTAGKRRIAVDWAGNVIGLEDEQAVPGPGLTSAGLYVIDGELAALIPPGVYCDLERDLFQVALDLELGLRVEQLVGAVAIGAPEPLDAAHGGVPAP